MRVFVQELIYDLVCWANEKNAHQQYVQWPCWSCWSCGQLEKCAPAVCMMAMLVLLVLWPIRKMRTAVCMVAMLAPWPIKNCRCCGCGVVMGVDVPQDRCRCFWVRLCCQTVRGDLAQCGEANRLFSMNPNSTQIGLSGFWPLADCAQAPPSRKHINRSLPTPVLPPNSFLIHIIIHIM